MGSLVKLPRLTMNHKAAVNYELFNTFKLVVDYPRMVMDRAKTSANVKTETNAWIPINNFA